MTLCKKKSQKKIVIFIAGQILIKTPDFFKHSFLDRHQTGHYKNVFKQDVLSGLFRMRPSSQKISMNLFMNDDTAGVNGVRVGIENVYALILQPWNNSL